MFWISIIGNIDVEGDRHHKVNTKPSTSTGINEECDSNRISIKHSNSTFGKHKLFAKFYKLKFSTI